MTVNHAGWMAEYEAKARQLSPLRLSAMQLCSASRLELTSEARMGVLIDSTLKGEVRSAIGTAISDRAKGVIDKAAEARFMPG